MGSETKHLYFNQCKIPAKDNPLRMKRNRTNFPSSWKLAESMRSMIVQIFENHRCIPFTLQSIGEAFFFLLFFLLLQRVSIDRDRIFLEGFSRPRKRSLLFLLLERGKRKAERGDRQNGKEKEGGGKRRGGKLERKSK